MQDKDMIALIRAGDQEVLNTLYTIYRDSFLAWIQKRYGLPRQDAIDVFQRAVLILYENIASQKLTDPNLNLKSYIFSIGKNKVREWQRAKEKKALYQEFLQTNHKIPMVDELFDEENLKIVEHCLNNLENPCKEILLHYFYLNLSTKEIAERLLYKNANTVKTMKYKCLQKLRTVVQRALENHKE